MEEAQQRWIQSGIEKAVDERRKPQERWNREDTNGKTFFHCLSQRNQSTFLFPRDYWHCEKGFPEEEWRFYAVCVPRCSGEMIELSKVRISKSLRENQGNTKELTLKLAIRQTEMAWQVWKKHSLSMWWKNPFRARYGSWREQHSSQQHHCRNCLGKQKPSAWHPYIATKYLILFASVNSLFYSQSHIRMLCPESRHDEFLTFWMIWTKRTMY